MRTPQEFENERYFGLQKFDNPQDAFKVMEGAWGETNADDNRELHILTDDTFEKAVLLRAIEIRLNYLCGKITEEDNNKAFGYGIVINSDLLDFDYFLYSHKSSCYYTSRMSFKDDQVHMWNKRQWGYYDELWNAYSFEKLIRKAIEITEDALEGGSISLDDIGSLWDNIYNRL